MFKQLLPCPESKNETLKQQAAESINVASGLLFEALVVKDMTHHASGSLAMRKALARHLKGLPTASHPHVLKCVLDAVKGAAA